MLYTVTMITNNMSAHNTTDAHKVRNPKTTVNRVQKPEKQHVSRIHSRNVPTAHDWKAIYQSVKFILKVYNIKPLIGDHPRMQTTRNAFFEKVTKRFNAFQHPPCTRTSEHAVSTKNARSDDNGRRIYIYICRRV